MKPYNFICIASIQVELQSIWEYENLAKINNGYLPSKVNGANPLLGPIHILKGFFPICIVNFSVALTPEVMPENIFSYFNEWNMA